MSYESLILQGAKKVRAKCLWPFPFNEDTLDAVTSFVFNCWTWNEAAKEVQQIPDKPYIRAYIKEWFENRASGGTIVCEKCRRMLISWVSRSCELWDMGLHRADGLLVGEDLEAAAKQMWRYAFLYETLQSKNRSWNLPDIEKWKYSSDRLLKSVELPNGSRCNYANGQASTVQGEGVSFVVCEEPSIYQWATSVLAQSKIITQGEGGKRAGYVHWITNAKADNENWQSMKREWVKLDSFPIMNGFTYRLTPGGEKFLELDWWADGSRDEKWLEEVRTSMLSTPFEFNEQILRRDQKSQGALWSYEMFQKWDKPDLPEIVTLCVSVDPSVSDPEMRKNPSKQPDECGIIVVGVDGNAQGHVFKDLSGVLSPDQWAKRACGALQKYAQTLKPLRWVLIAEKNQGGELVRAALDNIWPGAPIELVHAAIGKRPRAEPVVQLYEQARVWHHGHLGDLERQLCVWNSQDPGAKSPGRLDALVWAFTGLGLCGNQTVRTHTRMRQNEDSKDD